MEERKWLGLQFFAAEGATGGEGGEGATPGVEAASPGQEDALAKLGIPREEAEKYGAKMRRAAQPAKTEKVEAPKEQPPEGPPPVAEAKTEEKPAKATLAELAKSDPEYAQQLQGIVSERVKGFAKARDDLKTLKPALDMLAKSYGMDPGKGIDYGALAKAVTEDDRYWEKKAEEFGVTPDVARKIEGYDQLKAAEEQRTQDELQRQQFSNHVEKLVQQGEEMKKTFKDFDLKTELNDPTFRRLTSPEVGLSVRDAYYAIHHDAIRQAEAAVIAQRTQEAIANRIAAGQDRPREGGGGQAASTGEIVRKNWSMADIERVKHEAELARARGEKYYIR